MATEAARKSGAAGARDDGSEKGHALETQDTMTPKGTLFVLFFYAAALIALWGYMYLTLLMRR